MELNDMVFHQCLSNMVQDRVAMAATDLQVVLNAAKIVSRGKPAYSPVKEVLLQVEQAVSLLRSLDDRLISILADLQEEIAAVM